MTALDRIINILIGIVLVGTLIIITLNGDKIILAAYKASIPVSEAIHE